MKFKEYLNTLLEDFEKEIQQEELNVQINRYNLEEAKTVGNIYHFTTPSRIESIITSGTLVAGAEKYISFTRNPRLTNIGYFDKEEYVVRLTFDGNKISENLKVQPISDINYNDESEEGVLDTREYKRGNLTKLKLKYLIQVDILPSKMFTSRMLSFIGDICKKYNITCNFVHSFTVIK